MRRQLLLFLIAQCAARNAPAQRLAQRRLSLQPLNRQIGSGLRGGAKRLTQQLAARGGRRARDVQVTNYGDLFGAVFNLVNNVAGCGFLTLAAGAAGIGFVPACSLVACLGAVSCASFLMLGDDALRYGVTDVRGLWAAAVSERSAWAVDASVALFCGAAAVIYHGIVGDVFAPLLGAGPEPVVLGVAALVLWPLCQLPLRALASCSSLGCAAVALTALVIVARALDGSYAPGGRFRASAAALGPASGGAWALSPRALVLTANLGLAYVAHYNAPPLAESLAAGQPPSPKTRADFRNVTFASFVVLVALYAGVMAAAQATFGDAALPNVLLNYAPEDALARAARLATGASIIFGFPLVFGGFYDSSARLLPDTAAEKLRKDPYRKAAASLVLVLGTAAVALAAGDIGLPAGLAGSVLGGFVVYVLPAAIRWRSVGALEKAGCALLAALGVVLGGLGAYQTLQAYGLV